MTAVLTIGHSRHELTGLVALLASHQVAAVVDVRSRPYSRWAPAFVKRSLERSLPARGVAYHFFGRELGGLLDGKSYAERAAEPDFVAGLERLIAVARQARVALMCAEEDPARCHRRLLITPALRARGVQVSHIRGDGRLEPEPPSQLSLF